MAPDIKYFTAEPEANVNAAAPSENKGYTLAYTTYGSNSNPAVLLPTCYSGRIQDTLNFLYTSSEGKKAVLEDYFVIVVGLLGGSQMCLHKSLHAQISAEDNIRIQHALCQALGVKHLHAYIGFSMGGQQAYHMATIFPDFVSRIVVLASSARTSWHNWSFLEGPRAALVNSVDFKDGEYTEPATRGLKAFARVYSTWALSQEWYRQKNWEGLGFGSLEEFMQKAWEARILTWDAHDLLCLMQTWQRGDISLHGSEKGDLPKALASIKAKVLLMPSRTDMYFPPEDSEEEVKHLKNGKLSIIESAWGHFAGGGGGTKDDNAFIETEVKQFLHS
ncbi:Alpha/Beta hydrolase protein [Elsinoe ampelina]|uniref:Alpha/Beta hydrolase protein n=1 Tax=Elsinoe ampelina TaxID=302913 RepID=A0A6A6G849_9PEZI|nr:Alpha/Beta hydrolase protein [Elsinoe ampelina]